MSQPTNREPRIVICACGAEFEIPVRKGRPPKMCLGCREAKENGTLADRLAKLAPEWIGSQLNKTPEELAAQVKPKNNPNERDELRRKAEERIDTLEMLLKSRGLHLSQHPER